MKKMFMLLIAAVFISSLTAYAVDFGMGFSYSARTGDKEFDMTLGNLNLQAKQDMGGFISDLSTFYNVPQPQVEKLIYEVNMPPADAYMAISLAKLLNKPLEVVVMEYKANRGKGWGVIAHELGIKPGSDAFHALKDNAILRLNAIKEKNKEKKAKKGKK